jgi:hypothetical protein
MAEKRAKAEAALHRAARLDWMAESRPDLTGGIRSGEDRRQINLPPPLGSPVRAGVDRRVADRRAR